MSTLTDLTEKRRRHRKVSLVILGLSLLFITVLFVGLKFETSKVPSALLNKPAKPFSAEWLQGQEAFSTRLGLSAAPESISLAALKGRPFILNFWASWCVSCREEAAFFEAYWQKHRSDGPIVVGIAIQDSAEEALRFAKFFGKTYPLGLDTDGKASIDYGVYGVPETFFVDKDGIIRHKEAGPVTVAMLEEFAAKIQSEGPP